MVFYDFMTIFRNFKNQSHRFMTIFNNLSNQGVASHSKIKTLRYFRLRSSAHDLVQKITRHNKSTTRGNTRQHEYNTTQHEYNTRKHDTIRDNMSIIQYSTSKIRLNTSTKEVRTAKIGLYFALFVTKLYILYKLN